MPYNVFRFGNTARVEILSIDGINTNVAGALEWTATLDSRASAQLNHCAISDRISTNANNSCAFWTAKDFSGTPKCAFSIYDGSTLYEVEGVQTLFDVEYSYRAEWDGTGGNMRLYRNGVQVGSSVAYTKSTTLAGNRLTIGRWGQLADNTVSHQGQVHTIKRWNSSATLINTWLEKTTQAIVATTGTIEDTVGTDDGTLTLTSNASWWEIQNVAGDIPTGPFFHFNGDGEFLYPGDIPNFHNSNTTWRGALEFKLKITGGIYGAYPGDAAVDICGSDNDTGQCYLQATATGRRWLLRIPVISTTTATCYSYTPNQWHTIRIEWDRFAAFSDFRCARLVVDGVEVIPWLAVNTSDVADLWEFGGRATVNTNRLAGIIADIKHYDAPAAGSVYYSIGTPTLLSSWDADDLSSTIEDTTGSADMTLSKTSGRWIDLPAGWTERYELYFGGDTLINTSWAPDLRDTAGYLDVDVNVDTVADYRAICANNYDGSTKSGNYFLVWTDRRPVATVFDGAAVNYCAPTAGTNQISLDTWTHLNWRWTGASSYLMGIHIDGGSDVCATPSYPDNTTNTQDILGIGHLPGYGSQRMLGKIKDLKIYSGTYGSGTLLAHWPIDDAVANGGEITDISGNNRHGTLTIGSGYWDQILTYTPPAGRSFGQIMAA